MTKLITSRELMEKDLADRPSLILSDGTPLRDLIDLDKREISMRVLNDPELHRLELKYIFARAWIVVGHATEIPEAGDFILRHVGQDQVIVTRGRDGQINALLNACSHRGMEICWADEGNQSSFKCPYHGWVFNPEGRLMGAPFEREMYGDWDKSRYGLRKAHVAVRHGVIFAAFDPICDLDDWLGEFGWYFDKMYGSAELEALNKGGLKQTIRANWKAAAEQNCGDGYHTVTLHHALVELGLQAPANDIKGWSLDCHDLSSVEGHGLRCVEIANSVFHVSPEPEPFPVGWFIGGAMFPGINVGMNATRGGGPVLGPEQEVGRVAYSANLGAMMPADTDSYSTWGLILVEKDLPEEIKASMRRSFVGAVIGSDDQESWPSMTRVAKGYIGSQQPIRYNAILGANKPDDWPGPALVHRGMSKDDNQWHFWLRWYDMMTTEAA